MRRQRSFEVDESLTSQPIILSSASIYLSFKAEFMECKAYLAIRYLVTIAVPRFAPTPSAN